MEIALLGLTGAVINLHLIKNLAVFHNSFGLFWGVRTIGEIGNHLVYSIYIGLVTLLQPTNIPVALGIFAYQSAYAFAFVQCLMNLVISANRFVAVCFPLYYKVVFRKKFSFVLVSWVCFGALFIVSLYLNFPCNHLGYSPRFYVNVFIECRPDLERDYSIVTKFFYRICFIVTCLCTGVINSITFCRIVVIRLSSITTYNDKEFHRDVRLFTLSAVQDILMTIVVFLCNNDQNPSAVAILLNTDGFIFIYAINTASMMFCNSECRRYLFSKLATRTSSVSPNLASDRVVASPEKWT
uniref:7TM_GPCR_Srx domain-containing protein n=1 Tax=Steinernema glaseri TaxID=37863 RepID=A0A1I7YJJ7_9BILA